MSEERPPSRPLARTRRPLSFELPGAAHRRAFQRSSMFFYSLLTLCLVGLAVYMAFFERHPLDSPFVIAPAIGALWFALRLFMIWGSSNAR